MQDPMLNPYMIGADPAETEGLTAYAGTPLADPTAPKAEMNKLVEAMQTVYDPEIPVDIYELGLIYKIDQRDDGSVGILMTLTAPGCPVAGEMPQEVADAAASVEGVGEVDVTLTWDPPWTKDLMSEDAQLALGLF